MTNGVNFAHILCEAFTGADSKSAKNRVKQSTFFALMGSAHEKTTHKNVGEIADHGRSDWLGYWDEFVQKARYKKLACLCHIKQNDLTYLGRVCTPCLSVSTGIYCEIDIWLQTDRSIWFIIPLNLIRKQSIEATNWLFIERSRTCQRSIGFQSFFLSKLTKNTFHPHKWKDWEKQTSNLFHLFLK